MTSANRLTPLPVVLCMGAFTGLAWLLWPPVCPQSPTEIFAGVRYRCERLQGGQESRGVLHIVTVDLAAPGIELYVTPLDAEAVAQGWQYRLRWIGNVLRQERLAVAINGSLFTSNSRLGLRLPGDLAKGVETVVADHIVSHVWEHTYLLWFDDQLRPHLRPSKPPSPRELMQAKWGIGGQAVWLHDGKVWPGSSRSADSRTAVAIDGDRKLLFLAVAEYVSPRMLLEKLAELGAKDGTLLDGGSSTAMAIGSGAIGVSRGVLYGGWRPVASFFGVRAQPVRSDKYH
jgi:hypothetical protein